MDLKEIERTVEARIRQHRTADFHLNLRDKAGVPVPAAQVDVRLLRHEFRLGANGFLIQGGGQGGHQPRSLQDSGLLMEYERMFVELLNSATLPFYWGGFEREPGQESIARLREMAAWCHMHGVKPKGHPLAWHEVFPKWADGMQDEEVLRRLRERVTRLVSTFRGTIDSWDVCNETTVAAKYENAVGRRVKANGAVEFVAEMISLARAANPGAELLYNDFNVSPEMEALVAALPGRGAAFDAIGIQSHMHKGIWPMERVWEICETYGKFGKPVHWTEATILSGRLKAQDDNDWFSHQAGWVSTPEGEAHQLEVGRRFYTLLFSHPAVEAVTWWDFSDRATWQGAPAGLLRKDMTLKPLGEWLRKAFRETWTTRESVISSADGAALFRGFFGLYSVHVRTSNGLTLAGSFYGSRSGSRSVDVNLS